MKWLLYLVMLPLAVHAEIYKWVDANGTVVYSDQPAPGATQVKLPPSQVINNLNSTTASDAATNDQQTNSDVESSTAYKSVTIESPKNGDLIRTNQAQVSVSVQLVPDLKKADKLTFMLDGVPSGSPQQSTDVLLNNVPPGEHKLQVAVVDSNGQILSRSATITFYLLRTSVNNNNNPLRRPIGQ